MKRLLIAALPLLIAACAKPPQESATGPAPATPAAAEAPAAFDAQALPAYRWRLAEATDTQGQRIDALFARADRPLTLDFGDGRIAVDNACNRLSGGFTAEGDRLTVGQLASTMMACPDPAVAALDSAIGDRLAGVQTASLQRAPEKLTLKNAAGDTLVFDGAPTPETLYGSPGERVFLEVAAQTKPCSHPLIPGMQCLQVREVSYDDKGMRTAEPGEFQNFYDEIEGYTHEPGVRNVLRVKRFKRDPAPADASSSVYVLDMVVESEAAKP
ncbi:MAG: META and DUF4377 domain-containing protein [Pseudoxanthomonas sp.]